MIQCQQSHQFFPVPNLLSPQQQTKLQGKRASYEHHTSDLLSVLKVLAFSIFEKFGRNKINQCLKPYQLHV